MGIEVQLRTETGDILDSVGDPRSVLARADLSDSTLLRYLVPWGDAMFNQAQADALDKDIRMLLAGQSGGPLAAMLCDIQPLVEKLKSETHIYLWFVGD